MSFTRQVKQELVRHERGGRCCGDAELTALLLLRGYLIICCSEYILSIEVEHMGQARHLFSLFKAAGAGSAEVLKKQELRLKREYYLVQVTGRKRIMSLLQKLGFNNSLVMNQLIGVSPRVPPLRCCRRSFLRGAFLAGGSLSAPARSGYHLEISCGSREAALVLLSCLDKFNIRASIRQRRGNYYLYQKSSEAIADFLRVIGADSALLRLESARVIRSMRSQVNRLVNCETANLEKVVASVQQQLALIDRVEQNIGLSALTPALRAAAVMRRRYPEASLRELGRMFDPPLSKSAVNHRFRKLAMIDRDIAHTQKILSSEKT
ncbi:MAG: DNA-binding protein WhiA [Firmicutes bacterium]|nr:DNA-binding protein WhiA [Bacillota bacterium]